MTEKQFQIGQIVTLPPMTLNDSGKQFYNGGNPALHSRLIERGKSLGYDMNDGVIIPISAKVVSYSSYNSKEKCHEIMVEWIDPFSTGNKFLHLSKYRMLESEFQQFKESPVDFVVGDWVYYLGGCNTEYWQPGKVGQISSIEGKTYRFDNKKGDMTLGGSNDKKYFRRATLDEINRACAGKEYFTDLSGRVFSKPSEIFSNKCSEIKMDVVDAHSLTLSMFLSSGEPSVPSNQQINDETKVSFQSTKLIANKVTNSREVENFLLIN